MQSSVLVLTFGIGASWRVVGLLCCALCKEKVNLLEGLPTEHSTAIFCYTERREQRT